MASFALGLENPARTAGFASNILINGLPKDFYRTYLQKINAVTVDDIQRVAQKYFNYNNTRVVVVGKSEAVKPGLAKLGYAVNMYDKNAMPVTAKATAAVNMTADQIIQKYITASGGAEELKKINSITLKGTMKVQGMELDATTKRLAPNLEVMEISMNGQTAFKQAFDGTTGYQSQMGQKKDMDADEINMKKDVKGIFPQLFYGDGTYKTEVVGTEKVGDADAYKIKVTGPSGNSYFEFYDATTGLLLKEEITVKMGGADVTSSTEYSKYQKVENIMLPFITNQSVQSAQGAQEFVLEAKEFKLNETISADDFK
jgi:hypothetical protein